MAMPAKVNTTAVARPLPVLVPLIKYELEEGYEAGVEHYRRAGEMLVEAKEQVNEGKFRAWLEENFQLSEGTAYRYMKLANLTTSRAKSPKSIRSALGEGTGKVTWQAPVQQVLTERVAPRMEKWAQEQQKEEKEQRLLRALGLELIEIGFKVLATKLHPDKPGGSTEAMARLNRVRALLRTAL